jgi:hypothetical protein
VSPADGTKAADPGESSTWWRCTANPSSGRLPSHRANRGVDCARTMASWVDSLCVTLHAASVTPGKAPFHCSATRSLSALIHAIAGRQPSQERFNDSVVVAPVPSVPSEEPQSSLRPTGMHGQVSRSPTAVQAAADAFPALTDSPGLEYANPVSAALDRFLRAASASPRDPPPLLRKGQESSPPTRLEESPSSPVLPRTAVARPSPDVEEHTSPPPSVAPATEPTVARSETEEPLPVGSVRPPSPAGGASVVSSSSSKRSAFSWTQRRAKLKLLGSSAVQVAMSPSRVEEDARTTTSHSSGDRPLSTTRRSELPPPKTVQSPMQPYSERIPLPVAFKQLLEVANSLDTVLLMCRTRNNDGPILVNPSVTTLMEGIQRRQFKPRTLATIVAVDPSRYILRQQKVSTSSARRGAGVLRAGASLGGPDAQSTTWALTIDLATTAPDGSPRRVTSLSETEIAARRSRFRKRLELFVLAAHDKFLQERHPSHRYGGPPFHPEFPIEALALPLPVELPRPPPPNSTVRTAELLDSVSHTPVPMSSTLRFGLEATGDTHLTRSPQRPQQEPISTPQSGVSPIRATVTALLTQDMKGWQGVVQAHDPSRTPERETPRAPKRPSSPTAASSPPPTSSSRTEGPPETPQREPHSPMCPPAPKRARPAREALPMEEIARDLTRAFDDAAAPVSTPSSSLSVAAGSEPLERALVRMGMSADDIPQGLRSLDPAVLIRVLEKQKRVLDRNIRTEQVRVNRFETANIPIVFDALVGVLLAQRRTVMYLHDLIPKILENRRVPCDREQVLAIVQEIARRVPSFCSLKQLSAGVLLKQKPLADAAAARRELLDTVDLSSP